MKVWELIAELAKYPAGDDVSVSGPMTQWSSLCHVELIDDGQIGLVADEFTVVNEKTGDEIGKLSEIEF